jgi:CubicO group peptidase (beta-lactamase class C family)
MEGWKNGAHYRNEDVLRRMKKDTPNVYYIPDHRYNYCNTNYCLLALIAERATDTSYKAAMEKWVYEPSGMKRADTLLSLDPEKAKVKGHNDRGSPILDYPNRTVGDKGLYASARDLYRFERALRKGELLADSTLEAAYTPQHDDLYDHDNYGLGWRIDNELHEDRIIWHNGWWKGFRTYLIRLLDRKATIVVLNNSTRGPFFNNRRLIRLIDPDRKRPS